MKKIILFALLSMFLMSCGGGAGVNPDDYITWGQAFNHVSKSAMYWIPIVVVLAGMAYYIYRVSKSEEGWTPLRFAIFAAFCFIVVFAILFRPSEVAANTTVEQAARGAYIGY